MLKCTTADLMDEYLLTFIQQLQMPYGKVRNVLPIIKDYTAVVLQVFLVYLNIAILCYFTLLFHYLRGKFCTFYTFFRTVTNTFQIKILQICTSLTYCYILNYLKVYSLIKNSSTSTYMNSEVLLACNTFTQVRF